MYIGPPDDDNGDGGIDGSGEDWGSFPHEPRRSQCQEGNMRPEIVAMAAGSADVLSQSRALSSTGFVVAVDKDGGVWSWGEGRFGQLGHGDAEERLYPTRVEALRGVRIRWSAAGGRHSALVSEAGVVWTAGAGREGQLGHGGVTLQFSSTFQRVDDLLFGRAVTRVCVCVGGGGGGK
jgi:alpha-tubulin suppressor-like RCC1 family protein